MSRRLLLIMPTLPAIVIALGGALARAEDDPAVRYAPEGTDLLMVADLSAIYASPTAKQLFQRRPDLKAKLETPFAASKKVSPKSMTKAYLALNMAKQLYVGLIVTDVKLTPAEAYTGDEPREVIGRYDVRLLDTGAGVLIDDHTMLVGTKEAVREVLRRDRPAQLSDQMIALRRAVPTDREAFIIVETPPSDAILRAFPEMTDEGARLYAKTRWTIATLDVGEQITLRASMECVDTATVHLVLHRTTAAVRHNAIHPRTPAPLRASLAALEARADTTNLVMRLDLELSTILELIPPRLLKSMEK